MFDKGILEFRWQSFDEVGDDSVAYRDMASGDGLVVLCLDVVSHFVDFLKISQIWIQLHGFNYHAVELLAVIEYFRSVLFAILVVFPDLVESGNYLDTGRLKL